LSAFGAKQQGTVLDDFLSPAAYLPEGEKYAVDCFSLSQNNLKDFSIVKSSAFAVLIFCDTIR